MDNFGVARFYYAKQVPARAVAIAQISARPSLPADLTDINSTPYGQGALTVTPRPVGAPVDAAVIGNTVAVSGSALYLLENQYFEITDETDADGAPLYYRHTLPSNQVDHVSITDVDGNPVTDGFVLRPGYVLHNFSGAPYWLTYYISQSRRVELLQYAPVLQRGLKTAPKTYVFNAGGVLTVPDENGTYRIRFTEPNGYTVLPPYAAPPNDPWFARIRFNLRPVAQEWSRQMFLPYRPYMLATWVPGKVVSRNLVEFERRKIWFDPLVGQYPDVLVYDRNYKIKYALDGVPPLLDRAADKGYLFPWHTSRIVGIDPLNARLEVSVDLEPDDVVYAFYAYAENDLIYKDIDLNPFSNPAVKDRIVSFYKKSQPAVDPIRSIWYEVTDASGSVVSTNDPAPESGVKHYFGSVAVGFSVGSDEIQLTDARVRGGGLATEYQDIPEAVHFWDLGNLDGKPYPLGGTLVVHLPVSLLARFSQDEICGKVDSVIPMGTLAVIRYYDDAGEEAASLPTALVREKLFDFQPGLFDSTIGRFDNPGVRI